MADTTPRTTVGEDEAYYDKLERSTATVNAWSLAIVVEQLTLNSGCGGDNHEDGCAQCEAIKACQEAVANAIR